MIKKHIYLDYAATTPTSEHVIKSILPYFSYNFGNTESPHYYGFKAKKDVEYERQLLKLLLNADDGEIVFTSGGTEANNLAIKGIARAQKRKGKNHIIISGIEHSSICCSAGYLEECEGFKVTRLDTSQSGVINLNSLKMAITPETGIISIMYVNNEIGTIQPIKEACNIAKEKNIIFHTDAVQAAGTLKLDVKDLGIDLITISAHKFYGIKGAGALYIKNGIELEPIINGGSQEFSKRGGTLNVPSIIGMATAYEESYSIRIKHYEKMTLLQDYFINRIEKEIPFAKLNGDINNKVPQILNYSFIGFNSKDIIRYLDENGICCSSKSACTTDKNEYSNTLVAMGLNEKELDSAVRFSFGKYNTFEELDYTIKILKHILK